jgi:hypothetical protein
MQTVSTAVMTIKPHIALTMVEGVLVGVVCDGDHHYIAP